MIAADVLTLFQTTTGRKEMNRKRQNEFIGYRFLAFSSNGEYINSYIAKIRGRKVYGYYDWKQERYVEEPC